MYIFDTSIVEISYLYACGFDDLQFLYRSVLGEERGAYMKWCFRKKRNCRLPIYSWKILHIKLM